MDRELTLRVNVSSAGHDAVRSFRDMAGATRDLARAEKDYQEQLRQRVDRFRESQRIEQDFRRATFGDRVRAFREEQHHQQAFRQATFRDRVELAVQQTREQHQLRQELIRRGVVAPTGRDLLQSAIGVRGMTALGTAGMVGAVGAGAMLAAQHGLDSLTRIAQVAGDSFASARDKARGLAEALPIFGGLIESVHRFMDALQGIPDRLARAQHALVQEEAFIHGSRTVEVAERSADFRLNVAHGNLQAGERLARQLLHRPPELPADRSSVRADLEYRYRERMLGPELQKRTAERDLEAAQNELAAARSARASATRSRDRAEREYKDAAAEFERIKAGPKAEDLPPAGPGILQDAGEQGALALGAFAKMFRGEKINRQEGAAAMVMMAPPFAQPLFLAGRQLKRDWERHKAVEREFGPDKLLFAAGRANALGQDLQAKSAEVEKAITREEEAQLKLAQAKAAVRAADVAKQREELAHVREMRQSAEQRHQSWGMLQMGDRFAALHAAQWMKDRGFDALTPDQRAVLQRAGFGDVLAKEAERSAANDPLRQQTRKLLGITDEMDDLGALRNKERKLAVDVQVQPIIDTAQLAADIARALDRSLANLVREIKARVATEVGLRRDEDARQRAIRRQQ